MWGRNRKVLAECQEKIDKLERQSHIAAEFVENLSKGNFQETYSIDIAQEGGILMTSLLKFREKFDSLSKLEKQQNWVNNGLAKFVEILRLENKSEDELYKQITSSLVKYLEANQGGLFVLNNADELELKSCYAYNRQKSIQSTIKKGEGLLGQCVLEAETTLLTQIPDKYTHITSGLGEATPNVLLIVPLKTDKEVVGVLEIAGFKKFEPYQVGFVEKLGENIAAVIVQANTSVQMRKLLHDAQQNQELMRVQEEEMRQSMEELSATQEELIRREEDTKKQLVALNQEYERKLLEILNREAELKEQKALLVKALSIDNILIDVAGRNRMLSQKICFLCELVMSGKFDNREPLRETILLHDRSLDVIRNGGIPPNIKSNHEFGKADNFLIANIEKVQEEWEPFKAAALKIAEVIDVAIAKTCDRELEYIEAHGLKLLAVNNELVAKCIEFNEKKLLESGLMKL